MVLVAYMDQVGVTSQIRLEEDFLAATQKKLPGTEVKFHSTQWVELDCGAMMDVAQVRGIVSRFPNVQRVDWLA